MVLIILLFIAICLLLLSACSPQGEYLDYEPEGMGDWNYTLNFDCPYDISLIDTARKHVKHVFYLPERAMIINGRSVAGFVNGKMEIYLSAALALPTAEEAFDHELCHVYEFKELNMTWEHTSNHTGWY